MKKIVFQNLLIIAAVVLLVGCATNARQKSNNIVQTITEAQSSLISCKREIRDNPVYSEINPKLFSGETSSPSFEQITNKDMATEDERRLLISLHDQMIPCKKSALEKIGIVAPTLISPMVKIMDDSDREMLKLVEGNISWGEYTKLNKISSSANIEALQVAYTQLDRQLTLENQLEVEERQAEVNNVINAAGVLLVWADRMAQMSLEQQRINATNKPIFTNCRGDNYLTTCITQ